MEIIDILLKQKKRLDAVAELAETREEFGVGFSLITFKIKNNKVYFESPITCMWTESSISIIDLLNISIKIKRIKKCEKFVPQHYEIFFYVDNVGEVQTAFYTENCKKAKDIGNCFKTPREAELLSAKIKKVIEEHSVEEIEYEEC